LALTARPRVVILRLRRPENVVPVPRILAIHIAPSAGAPMRSVRAARAIPGVGLEGDRYAVGAGTFSSGPKDHELTLIEAEAVAALAKEGVYLSPGDTRRNITTQGASLNTLVNVTFTLGSVQCRGMRLCHPCTHLERHLARPGLTAALANRGGLRAVILTPGMLTVGDAITARPAAG
jgi:MOSC domain-containing protein YiiM